MSKMRALAILITLAIGVTSAIAQFSGPAPLAWRWQQPADVPPTGAPVVDGDIVYVASGQRMYALNRIDGNQKWRFPTGSPLAANFKGTITLGGGLVVAAADNRTLYALDAATGKKVWEYISAVSIVGAPRMSGDLTLFQIADGSVMAVNNKDGSPAYTSPITVRDGVQGSFNVSANDVLLFSTTNILYAVNTATQKVTWQRETAGVASNVSTVVYEGTVYFVSNNYVIALDAITGHDRFSKSVDEDFVVPPAVSKDGVLAITRTGKAYFLTPDGKSVRSPDGTSVLPPIDLKSPAMSRPAYIGKGLYAVATEAGTIELVNSSGVTWNYPIRPIGGIVEVDASVFQKRNNNGSGSSSGFGNGAGNGAGSSPGFGAGGGAGAGQGNGPSKIKIVTIQASGTPVVSGDTLLVLARDGSVLAFDKNNGVDLTPPKVTMTYPNAGDTVSPRPPLALVFKFEDDASGVNEKSIKILADGKPLDFDFNREGVAIIRASLTGKNKLRLDGKMYILIEVADWMGNIGHTEFLLNMDDALEPVKTAAEDKSKTGGKGGKGNGFGSAGG